MKGELVCVILDDKHYQVTREVYQQYKQMLFDADSFIITQARQLQREAL